LEQAFAKAPEMAMMKLSGQDQVDSDARRRFYSPKGGTHKVEVQGRQLWRKNEWGTMGRKTEGILMITLKVLMGN